MSASASFVAYVRELLEPLGRLEDGRFFGGHAFKHRGSQFAMVMGETLYFRVSDRSRPRFESAGCRPFCYETKKGLVQVRRYYSAPAELLEDPEQLLAWAREAVEFA